MISGTPVERVSSFKYFGVNISEDLTWTAHIQTQVKKARQRLYHLRQLRKFRVSPAILKTFYSGAIESVLTQCISVCYSNATNQDCKALQRVVRLAERISGSALPSLQDIYLKRCKSRAAKFSLHILLILFYVLLIFYLILTYIYIYSPVLCFIFHFIFLHCPLSGPVLTYISLLIIPCMIVYVTNNKEP